MFGNPEHALLLMSLVIFVPSLFALVLLVVPFGSTADPESKARADERVRWWSLLGTAVTLVLSLFVFIDFRAYVVDANLTNPDKQAQSLVARADASAKEPVSRPSDQDWVARRTWIQNFNIDYYLGLDGISMPLVLLTTGLSFLAMLASWNIDKFVRGYCVLFLILETGMLGTFFALDFFLFYIFWEVMLLPMYFLIGVWGGPRREYAAIKFFLYTLLGSVFILIALLGFYFTNVQGFDQRAEAKAERHSFDLVVLSKAGKAAHNLLQ